MTIDAHAIARSALALDEPERTAYLERSCSGDDALRARVGRLLTVMGAATIAPEAPPTNGARRHHADDDTDADATWIGPYRVLDVIGSGAMGVVYRAEQRSPRRVIALKVIRAGAATRALRERFEQETRVLARLKHPGIGAIYDAGSARVDGDDRPYFAMELVAGSPIDVHARALDTRARVAMLRDVCDAVEHAHRRGVVHRDLKPANILVDEHDRPRVLDFGVARALDDEEDPRPELVGTLPYMSPEQLRADPDTDTRADVYALGVILCELITGKRPHDLSGLSAEEARDHLERTPPTKLRALDPSADRDLEAIASRACARNPDDRYPSASALAEDLDRFLQRAPVEARRRTTLYVATRFAQRNRALVIAASLALVTLVAGAVGVSWQAVEATRGWARASEEARRVTAVNAFITGMLTSADPENALGEELTVRELLDQTARTELAELEDEPAVASVVRLALAKTYRGLGALDEAQTHGRAAVDASARAFGADDPSTADARIALSIALTDAGAIDEAERELERALADLARGFGDDSVEVATAQGELARVYHVSGRAEEALDAWGDALRTVREAPKADERRTLSLMHNYGSALGAMGDYERAEAMLAEVVSRRVELLGEAHPETIGARSMLASVVQKRGRNEEAAEQFRAILRARTRLFGPDHHSTYTAMGNLAATLIQLGELDEADRLTRAALDGYRATLGEEHAKTLVLMSTRAYLLEDMGRDDDAARLYRDQIAIRERSTGGRDPETWSSYNNLAMLLQRTDRADEALPLYERLLDLCAQSLPDGHVYTALFRNNYAECLTLLGRYDDARRALEASHPILVATFGEGHARVEKSSARIATLDRTASR